MGSFFQIRRFTKSNPRIWLRSAKGSESKSLRRSVFSSKLPYFSSPLDSILYPTNPHRTNRPSEILLPERLNQSAPPHNFTAENRAPRAQNPRPAVIALSSLPLGKKRLLFAFAPARKISPALRRLFASASQNRCLIAFHSPSDRNHKQETNFSA
jgi:hypothetical protein